VHRTRLTAAAALAATCIAFACAGAGDSADPAARRPAQVRKVLDGDTIEVTHDGRTERVRLIGVDAPEAHDSPKLDRLVARGHDRARILALGRRAHAFTQARLLGRTVDLELDVETHDRYGRLLAYVWLPDGTLFNATLLEYGFARVLTIPPNVRYADRFVALERAARAARSGLWGTRTWAAAPG
jgi:micrococcal nuclease